MSSFEIASRQGRFVGDGSRLLPRIFSKSFLLNVTSSQVEGVPFSPIFPIWLGLQMK